MHRGAPRAGGGPSLYEEALARHYGSTARFPSAGPSYPSQGNKRMMMPSSSSRSGSIPRTLDEAVSAPYRVWSGVQSLTLGPQFAPPQGGPPLVVTPDSSVEDDARAFAILLAKYPSPRRQSVLSAPEESLGGLSQPLMGELSSRSSSYGPLLEVPPPPGGNNAQQQTFSCRRCHAKGQHGNYCTICSLKLPNLVVCEQCGATGRGYFCFRCGTELKDSFDTFSQGEVMHRTSAGMNDAAHHERPLPPSNKHTSTWTAEQQKSLHDAWRMRATQGGTAGRSGSATTTVPSHVVSTLRCEDSSPPFELN